MKRPISELIGFQLINSLNEPHPLIEGNTCVYSFMQVHDMLLNTPKIDKEPYEFLRIYQGDIETPIMMFTGSVFTSDGYQGEVDPLGDE